MRRCLWISVFLVTSCASGVIEGIDVDQLPDTGILRDTGVRDLGFNPDALPGDDAAPIDAGPCAALGGDSDGDGVCDASDRCAGSDDAIDADNDQVPDGCDQCAGADDRNDRDNDGTADGCDTCPDDRLNDSDGDGSCDSLDICPGSDDRIDADGDTVPNGCDRCAAGDDRVDGDGDTVPDACDVCPLDAPNDPDGDGICTSNDICLAGNDTFDRDGDLVPDACDNCPSVSNPLQEDTDGVRASTTAFAPEPIGGTSLQLNLNTVSATIAIGFDFRFFGVTYSSLVISSNGFLSFDPSVGEGCCAGGGIPYSNGVDNLIALAWTFLDPASSGSIRYETRGTAPNRRFVVSFDDVSWCCDNTPEVSSQAILFEGTNQIIVHTSTLAPGAVYTRGVESRTGTQAAFLLGQRNQQFAITRESVLFETDPEEDDVGDACANSDDVQFPDQGS